MKNIKCVIGSMYGDEGKGFTVDYLCSQMKNSGAVLNVKFNGTAQAGHTVERNGFKHVFKTFGAGMKHEGVYTLLASTFVVDPMHLIIEANVLSDQFKCGTWDMLNLIYIDPECKVILPWDRMINEQTERTRKLTGENHGSCGYGLFESILRGQSYKYITIGELKKAWEQNKLEDLLCSFRDSEYYKTRLNEVYGDALIYNFSHDLISIFMSCRIESNVINKFDNIVFEGGQGLMLDWDREEFMPNLTASKTNTENVEKLMREVPDSFSLEVIYVTRTYHTRHGKGYMVHEVNNAKELGFDLFDETNQPNEFQETLRYGFFDFDNFVNNIKMDFGRLVQLCPWSKLTVMLTHSAVTNKKVLFKDKQIGITEFDNMLDRVFGVHNLLVGDLDKVVKFSNKH